MASFTDPTASPNRSPSRRPPYASPGRRSYHSPTKENHGEIYSDRFIPSRTSSRIQPGFSLSDESQFNDSRLPSPGSGGGGIDGEGNEIGKEGQPTLNMLLRSELLGIDSISSRSDREGNGRQHEFNRTSYDGSISHSSGGANNNMFRFKTPLETMNEDPRSIYDLSPVKGSNKRFLLNPHKEKRKICKVPFKVLDAPALQDDFYLNLVDWSAMNVLAVGLGSCVYLWSACTSKVTKLCELPNDTVTSVSWTQKGAHLAVGTSSGEVEIWDIARCKRLRVMQGHAARVGTMAWNSHILSSGSRDRIILNRDVRAKDPFSSKLTGHKQEVCGLKWSYDCNQLASGGNDNKLFIWSSHSTTPVAKFSEHGAAVKAISWSPHQHGLLSSGGGTADRCIRFWNTLTSTPLSCIDTGSQVCNLLWSHNVNEIVSSHGYSLNQIIVWRYPSMKKVATLTGHTFRVLYLAMSPDGQTVVSGAGDETLRFWNIFPGPKTKRDQTLGATPLFPLAELR
mmetsp:Transcript_50918/g.65204  ORF Transcript_50918/g.65204 Transcript_50918/m.65204 type:complete len:509 (+) Transcript_50918:96-1622(+)